MDLVKIKRLIVTTHIGVPDEERAEAQDLGVNIVMQPLVGFSELNDELGRGVDYYQVSLEIHKLAKERPRKLIETLAEDIAKMILTLFYVASVDVEIEKYILSNAEFVGVSISRQRT